MTRPFLFLLILAAILGVSLGGAFIGGLVVGKGQADAATGPQPAPAFGPGGAQATGPTGPGPAGGFERPSPGAEPNSGDGAASGLLFRDQDAAGGEADALAGRSRLVGTVESVADNTITINTPQGLVQAVINDDTSITRVVEGTLEELEDGLQVSVMGKETEGEGLEATSVIIVTEGVDRPFDRGFWGDGGIQQGGGSHKTCFPPPQIRVGRLA